ncbi:hypothetical protein [Halocatena salina]|uniref:Uncharacterized protein n=1 Tax=Halocatena salina TaxID=2934340 RepID=A0A8U0A1R8_9EURY|nr:hypothetical protein [Halocatena salina]UPM43012.1 hypothetical protein MW046_00830 [Halocatena salina]
MCEGVRNDKRERQHGGNACAFIETRRVFKAPDAGVLSRKRKPMIGNEAETCNGVESYQKTKQRTRCRNCGRPVKTRLDHRIGCPLGRWWR